METEWMQRGLCREIPSATFFPSHGVWVEVARGADAWRATSTPTPSLGKKVAGRDLTTQTPLYPLGFHPMPPIRPYFIRCRTTIGSHGRDEILHR